MRMICRRHYPILLALIVFICLQVFIKLNQQLSETRVLIPDFPIHDQPLIHEKVDKRLENDASKEDAHKINNGEPIDKILEKPKEEDDKELIRVEPPEEDNKKEPNLPKDNELDLPKEDKKKDIDLPKEDEKKEPDLPKDDKKEQDIPEPEQDNDKQEVERLKEAAEKLDAMEKLEENKEKHVHDNDPDKNIEAKLDENPNKSEVLLQLDEAEAKKMIAQDVVNDENENAEQMKSKEDKDQELFIFPDERDADLYEMDYSVSHPFDNQCHYPVLKRDETDLLKNIRHYRRVYCPPTSSDTIPMISQLPSGEIMVGVPHRAKFRSGIKCMGREISGTMRPDKKKVTEIGEWFEIPQDRRIFINKDQFIVKCTEKSGKVLFSDVFASLSEKPRLKPESVEQADKYNIDIFVIDSTARNQFFRHMPLTMKFMRKFDFKFLHGHTKVGDNSAINLLPLLSGKVYDIKKRGLDGMARDDMVLTEQMLKEDFWKYSDMLIQIARDKGCPTLWNDDIASVGFGLFNYYAFPGFLVPPADYYYRPFYTHLYSKLNAGSSCANGDFLVPRYVQIWERFARRFAKECHFAFNFMTGLTHASSSNLELYDQDLSASLDRMEHDGVLDNSFIFIMGDHGQRISQIQRSYTGRIEERMPLVAIHVPQKFRQQYPEKVKQLEANQNRLTSNFDIHETLREIMGLETANREPVGRSLFHEIPTDRDCTDARVPINFCMCQIKLDQSILKPEEKTDIFDSFTSQIGAFFAEAADCIKSHKIIQPHSYTPYTISNQARIGIRYPSEWVKYLQKKSEPPAENNEYFDVEFQTTIDVKTLKTDKSIGIELKARVLWDKANNQGRLTATPLITNSPCGGIRTLDDICKCNEEN